MVPAENPGLLDEVHIVSVLENGKKHPLTERFDTLGVQLPQQAQQTPGSLTVMDECGHLKSRNCLFFAILFRGCRCISVMPARAKGSSSAILWLFSYLLFFP